MTRLVLAVETSCDETAAAIVRGGREVLSSVVASQAVLHAEFGGVVPELASRRHLETVNAVVAETLSQATLELADLDGLAVTIGPGLMGALLVGMATAKAYSYATGLPLAGVNHLEAHILAAFLEFDRLRLPALVLLASGGHTMLVIMEEIGRYRVLGETRDDAAGEAFDKVAKVLGLDYPGGPALEEAAVDGDPAAFAFPRAMRAAGLEFSFSGLKTSVLYTVKRLREEGGALPVADLAASFQEAAVDTLVAKIARAAEETGSERVILVGGVAANGRLRERAAELAVARGLGLYYPSPALCTDNAAMVAVAGHHALERGERLGLDARPDPALTLATSETLVSPEAPASSEVPASSDAPASSEEA